MMANQHEARLTAIHLLRAGHSTAVVARQLGHSERWVRKWHRRFESDGWTGLHDQSHAPKHHGGRLTDTVRQTIRQARSELEADAALGRGLKYIGARAVRTKLKGRIAKPVPGLASIERILHDAGMTHRHEQSPVINYPHLCPTAPHQLSQIDIAPHYLTGGEEVACFNGLDVVSRYPTGQTYARQRSQEAAEFCVIFWQTVGIPTYTQVDNQDCFSGGHTHPYVLSKVVRLALAVGTELVFSPVRHPESNGYIERFHQEYERHVWQDTYLDDLQAVQQQAQRFFANYRCSCHHVALGGQSPNDVHGATPPRKLSAGFTVPTERLPLTAGRVHFMRRLLDDGMISVLNVHWAVPEVNPQKGVWATLELIPGEPTLTIYDAAPDASERTCLVRHPFPVKEPIDPRQMAEALMSKATSA